MNKRFRDLNDLDLREAEKWFLDCCGSTFWARKMTDSRPFSGVESMITKAVEIWTDLGKSDWLEAFDAHPKIGSKKPAATQSSKAAGWSDSEQAGTKDIDKRVADALQKANQLYLDKFGYIFIVCATGKTSDEMLNLCHKRLANDPESEILTAADEQRKITDIRLRKMVGD